MIDNSQIQKTFHQRWNNEKSTFNSHIITNHRNYYIKTKRSHFSINYANVKQIPVDWMNSFRKLKEESEYIEKKRSLKKMVKMNHGKLFKKASKLIKQAVIKKTSSKCLLKIL